MPKTDAFTRVELLALLGTLTLLTAIVTPLLANSEARGGQAVCANNLRQIGRAFQVWSLDRGGMVPWRIPVANGGTAAQGKPSSAWWEFAVVSNELVIPRILACPSDSGVRPARNFSQNSEGGFLNASYRNNAVSYFLGSDAGYLDSRHVGAEGAPLHFVSGDRNLKIDLYGQGCASGFNNVACVLTDVGQQTWTPELHYLQGNILLYNGSVLQLNTSGLRRALPSSNNEFTLHLLLP